MESCENDQQARQVGVEWCIQQCRELTAAGAAFLHHGQSRQHHESSTGDVLAGIAILELPNLINHMAASFAQAQFGKPLDQITTDDLTAYFSNERDESLTLEFKSFYQKEGDIKHKENGLLRTICAFLNSTGGLLIWGAPIGDKNTAGEKVFVGGLSPVERAYTKDDFIGKISNRIIPFAAPVQFHRVEVSPDKFVYLFDVPESQSKPHQFENSYYIRLDGQTKAAPHYVIDALFKQVRRPELSGYLRVVSFKLDTTTFDTPNRQNQ